MRKELILGDIPGSHPSDQAASHLGAPRVDPDRKIFGMPLVISPNVKDGQFALVAQNHAVVYCGIDMASGKDHMVEAVRGSDGKWRAMSPDPSKSRR